MDYFLYARKSTDEDDRQILSIEAQITEVREYAEKEKLTIVKEFIESCTAKAPGRPIFNEMISLLELGKAEGILAWHPDRLARNSMDGGKIIYLADKGIVKDLKFPTYRFDNTAQGKFMLSIAFSQSKYYVDNLSENVKRGIRQKVRNGIYTAWAPVGYLNDPKTKTLILDKVKAPLIRKMFELYSTGKYTLEQLVDIMNSLGFTTRTNKPLYISNCQFILTNPFYYGALRYWGELFEGKHEPIITKKLFDGVQAVVKQKGKPQITGANSFVFKGLMRCAVCNASITAEIQKGHTYYHCTKKLKPCKGAAHYYVREEGLATQIQDYVQKVSISDDWTDNILRELEKDKEQFGQSSLTHLQNLKSRISEIDNKISKLIDLYLEGSLTLKEYNFKKNRFINEKENLQEEIKDFADEGNNWFEQARRFVTTLNEGSYALREGNLESQKEFLKKIGSNCILKERRLVFSTEGTFRPILDNAPYLTWWAMMESNHRP
ncbi:MAG: recombinase family protein [Candidatus Omnitrophota bacterium]